MAFGAHVSDQYADAHGLDKRKVIAIITRYILANQHIHILERIPVVQVDIPVPLRASAVVYAAIAGQPIAQAEDLSGITADIYRFEIDLAENNNGDLQVMRGQWQTVPIGAFLIGN